MAAANIVVLDTSAALDWFDPAGGSSYCIELRAGINAERGPIRPRHAECPRSERAKESNRS